MKAFRLALLAAVSFAASGQSQKAPDVHLTIGKSTLLRLPEAVGRVSVGNPLVADVTAISPTELYLLGKDVGTTNVIMWSKSGGRATVMDVSVSTIETHRTNLMQKLNLHNTAEIVLYAVRKRLIA